MTTPNDAPAAAGGEVGVRKGAEGGTCNRRACSNTGTRWWNVSTRAWYCDECARTINSVNSGPLCVTRVSLPPERAVPAATAGAEEPSDDDVRRAILAWNQIPPDSEQGRRLLIDPGWRAAMRRALAADRAAHRAPPREGTGVDLVVGIERYRQIGGAWHRWNSLLDRWCPGGVPSHTLLDALAEARTDLAAARADGARLRDEVARLSEPTSYCRDDESWAADEDYGEAFVDARRAPVEVEAYAHLGTRWAARLPDADAEGETDLCYFATEAEAQAAIDAAMQAAAAGEATDAESCPRLTAPEPD